jgi:methylmalonyl-CoA/ethylmalonyl-CoA epimerase
VTGLDHVAIACTDVGPTLRTLVAELGCEVLFGGANFGFRAMQLDCGDIRIELLEPWDTDTNDFLQRFLDANGEGPHHLTFKTVDIDAELERVRAAGYRPVGVNIDNPFWREAFLHPTEANGTVIQIAESALDPMSFDPAVVPEEMREYGPLKWWPDVPERATQRAGLRRVVVTTDEMSRSLELYADLLRGERSDFGEGWVELSWPGGGRIRLEHAAGRRQGIDRLEWTHDGPRREQTVGGATFVLYPEGG